MWQKLRVNHGPEPEVDPDRITTDADGAVTGGARSPEDTRWASPPPTTCPVHQRVATEQECQAVVEAAKVGQA